MTTGEEGEGFKGGGGIKLILYSIQGNLEKRRTNRSNLTKTLNSTKLNPKPLVFKPREAG